MTDTPWVSLDCAASLLAHVGVLEERDLDTGARLADVRALVERVGDARARARETRDALAGIPPERIRLIEVEALAHAELVHARREEDQAQQRVGSLEGARRMRQDDLDQARRELARARDEVHDASARIERVTARATTLEEHERRVSAEADALVAEVAVLVDRLRVAPRVSIIGVETAPPGFAGIDEWSARARAALFVARGALETDRDRIVGEANALVEGVLGASPGVTSVALVRRRIEDAFAAT